MNEEQALKYGTGEYGQGHTLLSGVCDKCGDVFFVIRNRFTDGGSYCSKTCSGIARRGITLEKRNCKRCQVEFQCRPFESKSFCSNKCGSSNRWESSVGRERYTDYNGYIKIRARNHPRASKYGKHVAEHAIVMENMLGRFLAPGENVHHKNGIRTDNHPDNLELWVKPQTPGQRVDDLIKFVAENYEREVMAALDVKHLILSVIKRIEIDGTLAVKGE